MLCLQCWMKTKTLKDVLPHEFLRGEYHTSRAYKLKDVEVLAEHEGYLVRWPGREKNVHFWWTLKDGRRVGWNESPARGWSFPVLGRTMTPPHPGEPHCKTAVWTLIANVYRCSLCGNEHAPKI